MLQLVFAQRTFVCGPPNGNFNSSVLDLCEINREMEKLWGMFLCIFLCR